MSLAIETDSVPKPEQINDNIPDIFDSIKTILEKDEAGVFNLKASGQLDSETERVDAEIQKRIQFNLEKTSQNEKLENTLNELKKKNSVKIQKLSEGLQS